VNIDDLTPGSIVTFVEPAWSVPMLVVVVSGSFEYDHLCLMMVTIVSERGVEVKHFSRYVIEMLMSRVA
jgi:hypothetical protein